MTTRLVAFDLDGTLFDSRAAILGCFEQALTAHGIAGVPQDAIEARIGLPLSQMLGDLVDPERIPPVLATYSERFPGWSSRTPPRSRRRWPGPERDAAHFAYLVQYQVNHALRAVSREAADPTGV